MRIIQSINSRFRFAFICLVFAILTFSASAQEMGKMANDTSFQPKHKEMLMAVPMPFFTHMGMPQHVRHYSLRFATLLTQSEGRSFIDFDFQVETGLSKNIGLLVRLDNYKSEIMFNYAILHSKNKMSSLSPLIEFEIPRHEAVKLQAGFSSTLSNSQIAFHQVIHYGLQEKNFEGSLALVYKFSKRFSLITEFLGEKKQKEMFNASLIMGIKYQVNNHFLIALGAQLPVTKNHDFTSQYILQKDLEIGN